MSDYALKLIDEAYERKSNFLDLGNCGLTDIPPEIEKLRDTLEYLNLGTHYWVRSRLERSTNLFLYNDFDSASNFHILSELKGLTAVSIQSCRLNERSYAALGDLSLAFLDVSNHSMNDAGIHHISRMQSLNELIIESSGLFRGWVRTLVEKLDLHALNIRDNVIGDDGAELISKFRQLSNLNIRDCRIGDVGADFISRLDGLTRLDIAANNIGPAGAASISKLKSLYLLSIDFNTIGDAGAVHLGALERLEDLSMSSNEIGDEGVRSLENLTSLRELRVGYNEISDEGVKHICGLQNLRFLGVNQNKLTPRGAEHLSKLSSLDMLSIHSNIIGDEGAHFISKLEKLFYLEISEAGLSEAGAREIARLPEMGTLTISDNPIGDAGVRHIARMPKIDTLRIKRVGLTDEGFMTVAAIRGLRTLDVRYNQIQNIPSSLVENSELDFDLDTTSHYPFDKIFLIGNPIINPPLEVLRQGRAAVIEYFKSDLRPLNECKLIFIGDGGVGKTSVMKKLVYDKFDLNEKTTHGINKIEWSGIKSNKGAVKVNLWDFGGQHIQHSLHQFFFTQRVVYVLVLNPRNDEKAPYWLDQVEKLGCDSECLVVYNWKDEKDKEGNYLNTFYELRKSYPRLKEPFLLSCATGDGMDKFSGAVKEAILSNEGLKTEYPTTWFELKSLLEKRVPVETNYIEYSRYEQLCEEKGYNDPEARKNLLRILDSVGSIVFFDKPILNQLQILNPEWITTGAYAILTSSRTRETKGHLKWQDLIDIFKEEKEIFSDKKVRIRYTEPQFQFIIQLMLDYRLCQKNPLEEHEYLIPSAFGEKPEKDYEELKPGSRWYRFKFDSPFEMLIMHRFIAMNIIHIVEKDYWYSGIRFKHTSSETFALLETNLYSKQIDCWIRGENKLGLWETIRADFRDIFNMYHNFPVQEEVLYESGGRQVFLPYEEMRNALKNGKSVIDYHPTYQLANIEVLKVLEMFESPEQIKNNISTERDKADDVIEAVRHAALELTKATAEATAGANKAVKPPGITQEEEDLHVRRWKRKAGWVIGGSLFIMGLILLASQYEWFLGKANWTTLKSTEVVKWAGIVTAIIWNGIIIKLFYDRYLDPSKEKAFRDNLPKRLVRRK